MTTTTIQVKLIHETCIKCGVLWAITAEFCDLRHDDKAAFYCPNGHGQVYLGKSHKQEIEDLKAAHEQDRAYGIRQRDRADANHRTSTALKGHVTRLRNRAAEGRCQWCDEVSADMAQHVLAAHPERVNDGTEDLGS